MLWKMFSLAVLAGLSVPMVAQAQTLAQIGEPAEVPPSSFKGDQYIDSRGCVFMRISAGGQMQWYPRVDNSHKVVCGYPPTLGAKTQIAVTAQPQAAPANPVPAAAAPVQMATAPVAKPAQGAPMETVASAMMPPEASMPATAVQQPAPYVAAAPASYQLVTSVNIPAGKIGCFRSAPVAELVMLRNGGTAVVCTRGDGTATGWRAPIYPANAAVGASLSGPTMLDPLAGSVEVATAQNRVPEPKIAASPAFAVPKGYKLAWEDDRLNPLRGQGTAAGWAAQDQVWTRTVPARLVSNVNQPRVVVMPVYASQVTVSSMSAPKAARPTARAATGRVWVQVGSFSQPANAQSASDRLAGLGLAVGKSQLNKSGKQFQIIFAGPFASAGQAQAALQIARQAGFGDAFIR